MSTTEAITAALEAKKVASAAWIAAMKAMNEAYRDYLLADDLGIDQSEAGKRYLALRALERKAGRAMTKAEKVCKFLGVSE